MFRTDNGVSTPTYVKKRDGRLEPFNASKIERAIKKAFIATQGYDLQEDLLNKIQKITTIVTTRVLSEGMEIDLEHIQDCVEKELMRAGFYDVAKNYILYRFKKHNLRKRKNVFDDIKTTFSEYLTRKDWRVNENANMGYSYQGLSLSISGQLQAQYWLDLYPDDVSIAHKDGYIHIHDLSHLTGYCSGWSLYDLILEGFNLSGCGCFATPAKHLDTLFGQLVNFIGTLQNEWAGAQGINSLDTLCAPFVYYDNLTYDDVKQCMQRLIYNLNTQSRWGGQCPFSNITFDIRPSRVFANQPVIIGGKPQDRTYSEFTKEMEMIVKAFFEVLVEGDGEGNPFTFPIPTINITEDFPWDSEIADLIFKATAKYGSPYFQNFLNSDMSPEDVRSFCCRLQLDKRQVRKKLKKLYQNTGGLFGASDLTGSIGVVTLNLAKYAYLANTEEEYFIYLSRYARLAKESLEFKRRFLTEQYDKGLYPWTRRYLKERKFETYFSTLGVIGGHEACLNLLGKGIETKEGLQLMRKTLLYLRELLVEFQEETGNLYNLEAVPGEGASYRLARIDREMYGDKIIQSGEGDVTYYTNSTQLPVQINDIWFAISHQNQLQPLYNSGTVFHVFVGESMENNYKAIPHFIKAVFSKTKLPYLSITPTFSICPTHGYISGANETCPKCNQKCNVYSRVVGYYRPVSRWNKGKQIEFKQRGSFSVDK